MTLAFRIKQGAAGLWYVADGALMASPRFFTTRGEAEAWLDSYLANRGR